MPTFIGQIKHVRYVMNIKAIKHFPNVLCTTITKFVQKQIVAYSVLFVTQTMTFIWLTSVNFSLFFCPSICGRLRMFGSQVATLSSVSTVNTQRISTLPMGWQCLFFWNGECLLLVSGAFRKARPPNTAAQASLSTLLCVRVEDPETILPTRCPIVVDAVGATILLVCCFFKQRTSTHTCA